ncbi:uncharacterized protein [Montipora foliosa]|uniref:uncharacterized protein n=1 Tax=Montipora foliosa TaxID=591990 RepID=UPI0035F1F557
MKEMWISILHHVVDEHEWLLAESGEEKCAHEPLSADDRNKPWLKKNTPAHNALREVVMDKNILRTLSYYVNFRYRAQYSKRTKQWTPVPIPKPKTYAYIPELMELIYAKVRSVEGPVDQPLALAPEDPRNIAQN